VPGDWLRRLGMITMLGAIGIVQVKAESPTASIDNGILHATIYLPDSGNGFYRGTRFDWSGVVANLTFAGHSYYGPWFTKRDPKIKDFIFDGPEIIAGDCSSAMGPVEEFIGEDEAALGFNQAAPNQSFVKIGVGVLKRPDDQKYSSFRPYEVIDLGQWKVQKTATSIQFTQRLEDSRTGYAYIYTKTLRLAPNKAVLVMEHSLKNIGRLAIDTDLYDHNFLVLDHQPTGPDFSVQVPFTIKPERPVKAEFGAVEGGRISYRKELKGSDVFTVHMGGLSGSPKDYDVRIENKRLGAGMRITGDRPLAKEELWSIRSTLAVEPFLHLKVAPGETTRWTYTYLYYTIHNSGEPRQH
jgi:hypothetical protein